MLKCKFCEAEFENLTGLSRHTKFAHDKTIEEIRQIYEEYYPKKKITSNMIECKICHKYYLPLGMSSHLNNQHQLSSKEYYDQYCKTEFEDKCKICGKPTSFGTVNTGYRLYCSSKCANNDPDVQQKMKQNNLEKYGVEHPLQAKEVQDKIRNTCQEKYGVDSFMQTKSFREKAIQALKSEEVIEKRKQTCLDRYGVENPMQTKEVQDRVKQTVKEKYGTDNIYSSEYGKTKIKETNLAKYGCENPASSEIVIKKIKNTKYEKSIEFCKENNCIPITEIDAGYSIKDSIFHDKLLFFNDRYYLKLEDLDTVLQYTPKSTGKSVLEIHIADQIKEVYNGTILRNKRSIIYPKELDIYLPDLKLAVEINGIWYHCINNGTPKEYHLEKSLACRNLGIRLIHIYEFEDIDEQLELLKSLILGEDKYPENDFNKNNMLDKVPKPEIIYKKENCVIYGAGKLY